MAQAEDPTQPPPLTPHVLRLGKVENERFLSIALHQGTARKSKVMVTLETLDKIPQRDPTILTVAFKRQRIYLFSKREPQVNIGSGLDPPARFMPVTTKPPVIPPNLHLQEAEDATMGRDVFNEKPALEDVLAADNGRRHSACHT